VPITELCIDDDDDGGGGGGGKILPRDAYA